MKEEYRRLACFFGGLALLMAVATYVRREVVGDVLWTAVVIGAVSAGLAVRMVRKWWHYRKH